jgi:hypothetical protein
MSFIDAVQVIDTEMGFISYRKMLKNFQENIIPMICDTLCPYFQNIEESAQFNELSFLHEKLQINGSRASVSQPNVSITSEQEVQ